MQLFLRACGLKLLLTIHARPPPKNAAVKHLHTRLFIASTCKRESIQRLSYESPAHRSKPRDQKKIPEDDQLRDSASQPGLLRVPSTWQLIQSSRLRYYIVAFTSIVAMPIGPTHPEFNVSMSTTARSEAAERIHDTAASTGSD